MQDKNEKIIKVLEKIEVELIFLENMTVCVAISDFKLDSSDMLGFSSFMGRIKKDIQESMEILSC